MYSYYLIIIIIVKIPVHLFKTHDSKDKTDMNVYHIYVNQ